MATTTLSRQFVWTVLPAGRAVPVPGRPEPMALLSVLLTPRLLGPGGDGLTVTRFGMQSWPQRLSALRFEVHRAQRTLDSLCVPYTTADGRTVQFSVAQQLKAWQAMFAGDTPVRPYQSASYEGRDVREFPASEAAQEIRGVYTATARAHFAHRGAVPETHAGLRAELRRISDMWQTTVQGLSGGPADSPADRSALARAYAFYRRDPSEFTPLSHSVGVPQSDFHDIVARLADHPLLLRALGLLVDLAVPVSQLAPGDPAELRVVPRWPDPDPNPPTGWTGAAQQDLSPSTAYLLDGERFVPASVPGPTATEFAKGLLPLAGAGVAPSGNPRFELMPFDVDGAALRMVGAAVSDTAASSSGADSATGALPTLRSMGFALVERDREAEHGRQLQRAHQRASVSGLLSPALSADSLLGGYRVDILDVETGRWYSLCQRRVRYTIGGVPIGQGASGDGAAGLLEEGYLRPAPLTTGADADDALFIHQTVARWDGWSLVAQRPERVMDTGDSLPTTPPSQPFEVEVACEPGSLPRLRFGSDYRLRVRIADLAGGGLRGDETGPGDQQTDVFTHHRYEPLSPPEILPTRAFADGEGQDRMVVRSDRATSASDYAAQHGYRAYDLRQLLAPQCSLELAEQHGRFDAAMGPNTPASEVNRLFGVAKRADREVRDIPGAVVVGAEAGTDTPPYTTVPEDGVVTPWLADPGSTHIALNARPRPIDPDTGTPGEIQNLAKIAKWRGDWPAFSPVALRLEAATKGCKVTRSNDHRLVTVALGPAEQVTFDIPSCPKTADVQLFGIAIWLGIDPHDPDTFQHIVQGENRLVTPPRTVTLVHAVQRPLRDPGGRLTADRGAGDTDAVLQTGGLLIDIPSTGRLDVGAEWTDQEDAPPARPAPQKRQAHIGSYDVQHLPLYQALPEIRQEFGDTRHRLVTYTLTGVSRFQDCFERALAADPRACQATGVLEVTHVPSSARPPTPGFQYAVPTFRWTETADGQSLTRLRQGGGLRVFLERPWFASGDDEALALLAWPNASAPDDALRYVCVAGRDPVRDTGSPPAVLTPGQFNGPSAGTEVTLPELQRTLTAIPYAVQYDEEGDRWYADIDLSPVVASSYFPFVRLALARFQPYTMAGVPCVSAAVRTEPLQLPPHRRLTVTRAPGQATVSVDGLGPGTAPNVVRTELQVLNAPHAAAPPPPGAADPGGWTTISSTTAALQQSRVLTLPDSGGRPLRIVVQEFETSPTAADGTGRLVYADIVPLGP
ncbi:hypothetical protein AB0K09_23320 [Streptomyces sp. NPDC049577]|uniref:hypothetical protein n=1 Tax=Streptomyces sp. NPDC049577 TaxID=3155153 RepID=UPI0034297B21